MSDISWRPTRLVAEDRATLTRASVEETSFGWVWNVIRGTRAKAGGGRLGRQMSKADAIAAALKAMNEMARERAS